MAPNLTQVAFEPVSEVPETASVCHVDEIEDPLRESLVLADEQNHSPVAVASLPAALVDECGCDIVKFTDYYRISRV